MDTPPPPAPARPPFSAPSSWSIYGRGDISARYRVLRRVGSGAYADVYRAVRLSDGLTVALKEVHHRRSALREIDALLLLRGAHNVIQLLDHYSCPDGADDPVLVLEFLDCDLASVVAEAGRSGGGLGVGEVKGWMAQVLRGVEACHRSGIVHRDLKPGNLLVSKDGVLKLADFGQARILSDLRFSSGDCKLYDQGASGESWSLQQHSILHADNLQPEGFANESLIGVHATIHEEEYYHDVVGLKAKHPTDETFSIQDGDASCLATCSTGDLDDDPLRSNYSYGSYEERDLDDAGAFTSCVGTRWFRAPELLYGSTSYGCEIDLWSLGCIFAELLRLEPLFPGASDIDQLGRIISTLGNVTEENWPGCSNLPDYNKISFCKVNSPSGLEACLQNRSDAEVQQIKRLVCYDPSNRVTSTELLQDPYFSEEPLPVAPSELKVPAKCEGQEAGSPGDRSDYKYMDSDSDDEFGHMDVSTTERGFSIAFS